MEEPACYLAGDVYWTEDAIKKIINAEVENTMFLCAPDWSDGRKNPTIKGREPLGYIVQNQKVFRNAINEIMKEIDDGKFTYDPVAWNLYRKLNNIEMDYHGFGNDIFRTSGDFLVIDDLTTDIDLQKNIPDLEKLIKIVKGGEKMVKVKVLSDFHLGKFNELKNIERANKAKNTAGYLYTGDIFECAENMAKYLMNIDGHKNPANKIFVSEIPIEVIPEKAEEKIIEEEKVLVEEEKPKRRRRKSVAKK